MARVECQEDEDLEKFSKINLGQTVEDLEFQEQEFGFLKKFGVEGRKNALGI